jgi:hypothetical protein
MKFDPAKLTLKALFALGLLLSSQALAKDTALWDGTCHNVTHKMDGFLKLFTVRQGQALTGYISISGWLVGSGEIVGTFAEKSVTFVSTDATGLKIRWKGALRQGTIEGEYDIADQQTGAGRQVGEFKVALVDQHKDAVPTSEASFKKLFIVGLESDLNAPVKLTDGSVAFGADALFRTIHPAGQGVSVRVENIDIEWKEGASHRDVAGIRKYTLDYTLYWQGVVTPTGWTKMRLAYNANLGEITEHRIIKSTGTTNDEVKTIAFGIGILIARAAVDALLDPD